MALEFMQSTLKKSKKYYFIFGFLTIDLGHQLA
jgi:hypothetical protein